MLAIEVASHVYLRQADAYDAAALAELRVAALTEMGVLRPCDAEDFVQRARRELWTMLRAERATAWLLCIDGRTCGCACVVFWERLPYPGNSLHAELAGVYVAAELRGKGYATELCAEALAAARARGVRTVVVHPAQPDTTLYRRFGFTSGGQLRLA